MCLFLASDIAPVIDAPLQAIFDRVRQLIDAAGEAGVQVLCLQEAWHMPFAFCTREKAWCEFAEPVHGGPSTRLCQELARKHGMVGSEQRSNHTLRAVPQCHSWACTPLASRPHTSCPAPGCRR